MDDQNADVRLALEEMRVNMDTVMSAGDAIDQKVNALLAAAGLLLVVISAQLPSFTSSHAPLFGVVLAFIVVFYLSSVLVVLFVSRPKEHRAAISSTWNELDAQLFGKSERDAILALLSGYVDQIQHNEETNKHKAKIHTGTLVAFTLIAISLVVLFYIK